MNKTWLIIRREYFNIVRKKSFLIATFLIPLGVLAFFALEVAALTFIEKDKQTIIVADDKRSIFTGELALQNSATLEFEYSDSSEEALRERVQSEENTLLLTLPSASMVNRDQMRFVLAGPTTIEDWIQDEVEEKIRRSVRTYRVAQAGLSEEKLAEIEFNLEASTISVKGEEEKKSSTLMATIVGFAVCFIIYMLVAIYGSIMMQGVIEEKSTRVVEVIVSSVRPFQLLLGKTVGLALVGLTQLLLWGLLIIGMYLIFVPILAGMIDPAAIQGAGDMPGMDSGQVEEQAAEILESIQNFDWRVLWFVPFYFIGGFFLYGSLYAAVGSAVDNVQDAQQFVFPITLPLMIGFFIVLTGVNSPNGALAVAGSLIPFTSPMVMPTRLAVLGVGGVPWWHIVLSIVFLIAGFLACVWIAGKIYRTGILMYGKKPTFKEMFRWVRTG